MQYINRELSWIEFNQRVLSEAERNDLPLLERLKFLAITASNLDEFYQVRVGGLTYLKQSGSRKPDIAGMTPNQQLKAIRKRALTMVDDQYALLRDTLTPELAEAGINFTNIHHLPATLKQDLAQRFHQHILPLLTPLSYDPENPLPHQLPDLTLILACELYDETDHTQRTSFIPLPASLGRFIHLEHDDKHHIVLLEDFIAKHLFHLFPGERVEGTTTFRITRNSDIAVQEEDAIDLAGEMETVLAARKTSNTVRLEIPMGTTRTLEKTIQEATDSTPDIKFRVDGPIALDHFMELAFMPGYDELKNPSWSPQSSPQVDPATPIFETLDEEDLLLYHPYESFEPVLRFIEEAAADPDVLAIKQVLYRTAKDSRIIDALIQAAESGKQVTALVELKARFDEARNLQRADELQRAGVQIVYGVRDLKTHAKITLVIRNENGTLRRYCHLGTGNYNESTAKIYTDVSYLTAREEYGADASHFFNAVTGRSKLIQCQRIVPAPTQMKRRLLELIASEAARAKQGEEAHITAKVNSLQDQEIIDALYAASKAGVNIKLNIRGICCLKTGDAKYNRNIRVVSVIDRYLEHARIFSFHQGGSPQLYIASADWMTRNLDKRVELMIPIIEPKAKKRLQSILEAAFDDNQQAHLIQPDGTSERITPGKNDKNFRLQEYLQKEAQKAAKSKTLRKTTTFEPHLPNQ